MSADRADSVARLSRLVGQHPAAIRTVVWRTEPLAPEEFGHLEIETQHGSVFVIDHVTGAVDSNPPAPPVTDAPRQ
ncbi:MAG: hypothetical protein P8Y69_16535, partial [Gammaproteobacteria bacterium]